MKKSIGILITIWSIIALVIIGMMIVGFSFYSIPKISPGVNMMSDVYVDETLSIDDVKNIKLAIPGAAVSVYHSENDSFRIIQKGNSIGESFIIEAVKNGSVIEVRSKNRGRIQLFNFGPFNSLDNTIDIYIPEKYAESLTIRLSAGSLDIIDSFELTNFDATVSAGRFTGHSSLHSKSSSISLSAGNLELSNLCADKFDISSSAGKLIIHNLSGSGKASSSAGSITLENVDINDFLTVRSSAGSINIGLIGEPSLEYKISSSAGSINTYFAQATGSGASKNASGKIGDAPYKSLDISASAGSINITKV